MTFVKKNTAGGVAGHSWEAGEVKDVNSYLADELVVLSPEDFEIVPASEYTPEPVADSEEVIDGTVEEVELTEEPSTKSEAEAEDKPVKAKRVYKKKTEAATETPSAE